MFDFLLGKKSRKREKRCDDAQVGMDNQLQAFHPGSSAAGGAFSLLSAAVHVGLVTAKSFRDKHGQKYTLFRFLTAVMSSRKNYVNIIKCNKHMSALGSLV